MARRHPLHGPASGLWPCIPIWKRRFKGGAFAGVPRLADVVEGLQVGVPIAPHDALVLFSPRFFSEHGEALCGDAAGQRGLCRGVGQADCELWHHHQ